MDIKGLLKRIDPIVFLCVVYALWLLNLLSRSEGLVDDFDVFFHSGKRLLNQENIYGEPHYINLKYFYSPLFSCLMALIQGIDLQVVKVFWFILNSCLLFRVVRIMYLQVFSKSGMKTAVFLLTMLLTAKIVLINYTFNQITILILWTVLESYHQLKKGNLLWSVIVLCIGINIKILPIVLVPYFLAISGKPLKMLGMGITTLLVFTFLPAVFIGYGYNNFLLEEWWKTLNPASSIHAVQVYEYGLLDAGAMISKYLSDKEVYLEPVLNIASLPDAAVFAITNSLRVALLIMAVVFAIRMKQSINGIQAHFLSMAMFMTLVPLCFPHQREYSYLFYLPMIAINLTFAFKYKQVIPIICFVFTVLLGGLLTWVDFVGKPVVDVFVYYRLVTMGMLLMMLFSFFYWQYLQKRELLLKDME
ncbi:MAG TPA: glycosyltransferase family 87 protein [Bacteroidia bacterium]